MKIEYSKIVDNIYSYKQYIDMEYDDNTNARKIITLYKLVLRIMDGELTKLQKDCLTMYADGLSMKQIAKIKNIDQSNVSRHINKGRKKIQKIVSYLDF